MLIRGWVTEAVDLGRKLRHPFLQQQSPDLSSGSQSTPRSERIHNPTNMFLVCLKVPSQLDMPNQMPESPQLISFDMEEKLLCFKDNVVPHLIKPLKLRPAPYQAVFCCLYLESCSFGHNPLPMITNKGWNIDRAANQELFFWAQLTMTYRTNALITANKTLICWSISHSILPSHTKKTSHFLTPQIEVGAHPKPGGSIPPLSCWEPWPQS